MESSTLTKLIFGAILFSLSLTVALTTVTSTLVHGFAPICHVNAVNYSYPDQVDSGQQFPVSASLSVLCPQYNNYHFSARFDITDSEGRMLASNYTQEGFLPNNGKAFAISVTNDIRASANPGPWRIKFLVYTFVSVDPANGLDYGTTSNGTIQVGQATAQQTSNNTTAVAALSSTSIPSQSSTQSKFVQPVNQASKQSAIGDYATIALGAVAIFLIFGLVLLRRRTR